MAGYITANPSPRGFQEELQWARIMASDSTVGGMVVVFAQALGALWHELQLAQDAEALCSGALPHFQGRVKERIAKPVHVLQLNGLTEIEVVAELDALQERVQACTSLAELIGLAEEAHTLNHRLIDGMEHLIVEEELL